MDSQPIPESVKTYLQIFATSGGNNQRAVDGIMEKIMQENPDNPDFKNARVLKMLDEIMTNSGMQDQLLAGLNRGHSAVGAPMLTKEEMTNTLQNTYKNFLKRINNRK